MKRKTWMIIAGVIVALLLVGSVGGLVANAQSGTPTATPRQGKWPVNPGKLRPGMVLPQAELDAAAKALGMTSTDLSAELKSGKTLAAIAKEKGVDLKTVQDAIQKARGAEYRAQITQAVTDGKMSQDKANWLLEGLEKGYITGPGFGFGFGFGGGIFPRNPAGAPRSNANPRPTPKSGQG